MTPKRVCRCGCGRTVKRRDGGCASIACARKHRAYLDRAKFFRTELKRLTIERRMTTETILDAFQAVYVRGWRNSYDHTYAQKRRGQR